LEDCVELISATLLFSSIFVSDDIFFGDLQCHVGDTVMCSV
jgi:hypothetical protein